MKSTKHFDVTELVHPDYIDEFGEEKVKFVLEKYAPFMLLGLEQLKEFVGGDSIIINDYKWGGNFKSSGLRSHKDPVGAALSAHYFMCATDCKIKGRNIEGLQNQILDNPHLHPYIVRMENAVFTKSWLHVQWGYRLPNNQIEVFNP